MSLAAISRSILFHTNNTDTREKPRAKCNWLKVKESQDSILVHAAGKRYVLHRWLDELVAKEAGKTCGNGRV